MFQCITSFAKAIPIQCFVSHRPPSREGGSVGQKKRKTNERMNAVKAGLLSTKAWLSGPFVRDGITPTETGLPNV